MSAVAPSISSTKLAVDRTDRVIRIVMFAGSVVAGIALVCYLGLIVWAHNEASQPESIVAAESIGLAHDGTLYRDLRQYPYTISAYTPVFYCLEAALSRAGVPVLQAGRLISFAAMLGIIWLCGQLVLLFTHDRQYAWMASLLVGSTALISVWGTTAQVDTLALFWTIAAFVQFSRYYVRGESTVVWAALLAIAGFFTKQTMIACPAAIFVLLWFRNRKVACVFAGCFSAGVAIVGVLVNVALGGRFLENTVFANLNPLSMSKLLQHLQVMAAGWGALLIIILLGVNRALKGQVTAVFTYLAFALTLLFATAPKVGSDSNYQLESIVLAAVCACVCLHAMEFFPLLRMGSKHWITLLPIPLGIHMLINFRMTEANLVERAARELAFRSQITALRPHFDETRRVISADVNAALQLGGRIEVDPFIYRLLVRGGVVDPEPLRRDLANGAFGTVLLYEDVSSSKGEVNAEIPSLPTLQISEVRQHYTLVVHVPGPYLDGVYVYKPKDSRLK